MRKFAVATAFILVFLVSCATGLIPSDQEYFQAMGRRGQAVITAKSSLTKNYRVSVQIDSDRQFDGIAQLYGIPDFMIKQALEIAGYEKVHDEHVYYTSDNLDVMCLGNSVVLFSNSDINKAYCDLIENRFNVIDNDVALKMKSSEYSVCLKDPSVLYGLASGLDSVDLSSFDFILLNSSDLNVFDSVFVLSDKTKSDAFLTFVKAKKIVHIRRNGEKIDYDGLMRLISKDNDEINIKSVQISNYTDVDLKEIVCGITNII